jgi:hypothetical protein
VPRPDRQPVRPPPTRGATPPTGSPRAANCAPAAYVRAVSPSRLSSCARATGAARWSPASTASTAPSPCGR